MDTIGQYEIKYVEIIHKILIAVLFFINLLYNLLN